MSLYRGYLATLTRRFEAALMTIEAIHNFSLGEEFEVVLCEVIRSVLPTRFGVCRGFVVTADNRTAGDDIVIYDQSIFPTLQLRGMESFARREHVPVEAIYAYIEAKHTLRLEGKGDSSLDHAIRQAAAVKELVASRDSVPVSQLLRGIMLTGNGLNITMPTDYPQILNPMYVGVIGRNAGTEKAILTAPEEIESVLLKHPPISSTYAPDIVVAGASNLIIPVLVRSETRKEFRSPFFIEGQSAYTVLRTDHNAFGIAMACLLAALEFIQLGRMPWHRIIVDGLGIPR